MFDMSICTKIVNTDLWPDKPSAMIRHALRDFEKCEKDTQHYKIDMGCWHRPYIDPNTFESITFVSVIGAVMAQTFNVRQVSRSPYDYEAKQCLKFLAVNHFCDGFVRVGLGALNIPCPNEIYSEVAVTPYNKNTVAFKRNVEHIATMLACNDL
jgi:hypothetical protein